MSAYTPFLHEVIEWEGSEKIGLNGLTVMGEYEPGYPIWDEGYRRTLNRKIIRRYWNREIGLETVEMFIYAMHRKMHEIMPYFNSLYQSTQLQFDPLKTVDISTVIDSSSSQTSQNERTAQETSEGASSSQNISSDFPQNMINNNGDYADSGVESSAKNTGLSSENENGTSSSQNTDHGETRTSGYSGIPADMVVAYRATLINIDVMILDSLSDLFMLVWDTSDAHTMNRGF